MTPNEQLDKWLVGEDVHNETTDECCPDFACCNQEGKWSQEMRERFVAAYRADDVATVSEMLMSGLTQLFNEKVGVDVHIAGQETKQ